MNRTVRSRYEQLAQAAGLAMDPNSGALYGRLGEYDVIVFAPNASYPYALSAVISAYRAEIPLSMEESKEFCADRKIVSGLTQNGSVITMALKSTPNRNKLQEGLVESLAALVNFLREKGFRNCCQACGKQQEVSSCYAAGAYMHLCPECYTALQQRVEMNEAQATQKKENVVAGIVGALLGSLIGVVCIVILSQLGYVAALSGVVMAVCTLKGYELLGGKLSNKGIVICVVLMLFMTFFGDRVDWAIVVARELEVDFVTAFQAISLLLEEEIIESSAYWGNLVLLYLFALIGLIPTVWATVRSRKDATRVYCLGQTTGQR